MDCNRNSTKESEYTVRAKFCAKEGTLCYLNISENLCKKNGTLCYLSISDVK
jgi:hypothetical protein